MKIRVNSNLKKICFSIGSVATVIFAALFIKDHFKETLDFVGDIALIIFLFFFNIILVVKSIVEIGFHIPSKVYEEDI